MSFRTTNEPCNPRPSRPTLSRVFNFSDRVFAKRLVGAPGRAPVQPSNATPQEVGRSNTPTKYVPYTSDKLDTWDALKGADGDCDTVFLLYSLCRIDAGSSGREYVSGWNREHIWPRSRMGIEGGLTPGIGTDLHNLFPTDASMNSSRGNRFFDEARRPVIDRSPPCAATPRTKSGTTECFFGDGTWEPPDESKGMIARAVLYMACVYADRGLKLVERPCELGMGVRSVLLRWNAQFALTEAELERDTCVHGIQGNHNPFVTDRTLADRVRWYR